MRYERKKNMVTKKNEAKNLDEDDFDEFPVYSSSFGTFPFFSKDQDKMDKIAESDFDKELDLGTILYFK
jgi:hypothetical protein